MSAQGGFTNPNRFSALKDGEYRKAQIYQGALARRSDREIAAVAGCTESFVRTQLGLVGWPNLDRVQDALDRLERPGTPDHVLRQPEPTEKPAYRDPGRVVPHPTGLTARYPVPPRPTAVDSHDSPTYPTVVEAPKPTVTVSAPLLAEQPAPTDAQPSPPLLQGPAGSEGHTDGVAPPVAHTGHRPARSLSEELRAAERSGDELAEKLAHAIRALAAVLCTRMDHVAAAKAAAGRPDRRSYAKHDPETRRKIRSAANQKVHADRHARLDALGVTSRDVRQWATTQTQMFVPTRGTLPTEVIDAYEQAHPSQKEATP